MRTDHLERLVLARTGKVVCWRLACHRMYWCNHCSLLQVAAEADGSVSLKKVRARMSKNPCLINQGGAGLPDHRTRKPGGTLRIHATTSGSG